MPGAPDITTSRDVKPINSTICLDPPPDLVDAKVVDGLTSTKGSPGDFVEVGQLRLYATQAEAHEAVVDFLSSVSQCLHGVDHVGEPMDSQVLEPKDLAPVDEAAHVSLRLSESGSFMTVVRRGAAVYLLDRTVTRAAVGPEGVDATRAASEDEVRPFLDDMQHITESTTATD